VGSDGARVTPILVCGTQGTFISSVGSIKRCSRASKADTWPPRGRQDPKTSVPSAAVSKSTHGPSPDRAGHREQASYLESPNPQLCTQGNKLRRSYQGRGTTSAHYSLSSSLLGWGILFSFLSGTSDYLALISLLIGGGKGAAT
jgi:hypothetical protein